MSDDIKANQSNEGLIYKSPGGSKIQVNKNSVAKTIDSYIIHHKTNHSPEIHACSDSTTLNFRRLEYLIKSFPKYFKFKYTTDRELRELYKAKRKRFILIDTLCVIINLIVITAYYFEVNIITLVFFIRV